MASEIRVPRLGWNMEEGTFLGWLKRDGDEVRAGETLFTLEGDKAVQEIEALEGGILRIAASGPKDGDTVAVGTLLGHVAAVGEVFTPSSPSAIAQPREQSQSLARPASPSARRKAREAAGQPVPVAPEERQVISPRARRTARERGVDPAQVQGTGRNGRIRERDILAQAASSPALSPLRRAIAERLVRSRRETAPVTLTTTADATNLVNLRLQLKSAGSQAASYTDILVKLLGRALREHPALNARWEADRLVTSADINIGIAVDTEVGLIVPVIHDAAKLTLREVAVRSRDLAERARRRKLIPEELQGGTFTMTNLGGFGIDAFTPLINWPEIAILGMGRIQKQPVVVNDQIVPRDMVTLSLTFDHRAVDGAPAARFLQTLCKGIENPAAWLVE